jgi:thymidylate synthase
MTRPNQGLLLRLDDFVGGYVTTVQTVMTFGEHAAPRGLETTEVLGATLVIPGGAPMLPVGAGRGVSQALAAEEALQLIGGYSDAEALFRVNGHLRDFADQGAFHGAYGPRVRAQMETAERRLREDPYSRRAVVSVWDPLRDSIEGVKNYPCTTQLQFMLRRVDRDRLGRDRLSLDLHVTMRSNDAWHGLAYDAFVFNQLQHTLARSLDVPVGTYYHHAASLHVYEPHWDAALHLSLTAAGAPKAPLATGVGAAGLPFGVASARARAIADLELVYSEDESEAWYIHHHCGPRKES